jgi:uncharacterized protein (TIGR01777 family)
MRVLVSGASGLIGSALVPYLAARGHTVARLVRREVDGVRWDPAARTIDRAALEGFDAVVHLSGESVLARWTPAKQAAIRASRVDSTAFLAGVLAALDRKPAVLVTASAIGYYGDRGDEPLTEDSPPGSGFLADVCRAWEAAAEPATRAGIRTVQLRIGLPLTAAGGILGQLLLPFRLGLGGPVGRGAQWWSWIALEDLLGLFAFALDTGSLSGPVNGTAPHAVTNRDFAATLGRVLGRPAFLPVPPLALRLLFGSAAADGAMLTGCRVQPARAVRTGFRFAYPDLEPALRRALALAGGTGRR